MAKRKVTISENNINLEFELEKVTRETEVGEKKIIYKDLENKELRKGRITTDGMNILLPQGSYKNNHVDSKGNYISNKELIEVDDEFNPLPLIEGNVAIPKTLENPIEIIDLLNYKITNTYILNPIQKNDDFQKLYNKVLLSFNNDEIFSFPYNILAGTIQYSGFLIPLENNIILLEVGIYSDPQFFSRKEAIEEQEDVDEPEDYDIEELFEAI